MPKGCIRAARGEDVGRDRIAVLYTMLLVLFQRSRGLDKKDWTSEACNDFLSEAIHLW